MSETTNTAQLIPLLDNLILEECEPVKMMSGFHVPEAHQRSLNQGFVVDKGPLCGPDPIHLGDIVFFTQHSESKLNFRGRKFIIVSEACCLGIIRGAKITQEEEDTPLILTIPTPGGKILIPK